MKAASPHRTTHEEEKTWSGMLGHPRNRIFLPADRQTVYTTQTSAYGLNAREDLKIMEEVIILRGIGWNRPFWVYYGPTL
jgi:hypothetical protein